MAEEKVPLHFLSVMLALPLVFADKRAHVLCRKRLFNLLLNVRSEKIKEGKSGPVLMFCPVWNVAPQEVPGEET